MSWRRVRGEGGKGGDWKVGAKAIKGGGRRGEQEGGEQRGYEVESWGFGCAEREVEGRWRTWGKKGKESKSLGYGKGLSVHS